MAPGLNSDDPHEAEQDATCPECRGPAAMRAYRYFKGDTVGYFLVCFFCGAYHQMLKAHYLDELNGIIFAIPFEDWRSLELKNRGQKADAQGQNRRE